MKEKCLFCDEILEAEEKNLFVYFDCMDHGWYAVSQKIHVGEELRPWALKWTQALVPVIQHHNQSTGRAFPIPDHWIGRKMTIRFHEDDRPSAAAVPLPESESGL